MTKYFGFLAALSVTGGAFAAPVTDWVQIFDGQTASMGITNAGTNSPTLGDADAASMAANFSSVTLADGEFITLTGSVTIDTALVDGQFRVGLFDGPDPPVAQTGAAGSADDYVGIYSEAPTGASANADIVFGAGQAAPHPFGSADATNLGTITGPGVGIGVDANEAIDFLLTIARDGANLDITASFDNNDDYAVSLTVQDASQTQYTYDTVALLFGGGQDGTSAAFSNIDVTTGIVPEPGSLALLGIGGLMIARRRRS